MEWKRIWFKRKLRIWNNGKLIFEGEYLNGERNGKGKEYNKYINNLLFEGEYLNGKRNGKGKAYIFYKSNNTSTNKIQFKGEFLNGKLWNGKGYDSKGNLEFEIKDGKGYIKEHDYKGNIIFEGEYLNGERNGKGKEYENGKLKFEGEYLNGKRNGKGKEYDYDGKLKFEGKYVLGKLNGKGKEYSGYKNCNRIFEGFFFNGQKNGKGKIFCDYCKTTFEGEYLNGTIINGKGIEVEGCFCGYDDCTIFIYEGNFTNSIKNGDCKVYDVDHNLIFEGEYLTGKKWNGKGKEFLDGYSFGKLIFEGEYLNGEKKIKTFKDN